MNRAVCFKIVSAFRWHGSCQLSAMIDNSFTMGMVKIIGDAKTGQEEETRVLLRRRMFRRVRVVISLLMLATILAFAYYCRAELQFLFFSKPAAQSGSRTSTGLKTAPHNTADRNNVANQVTK